MSMENTHVNATGAQNSGLALHETHSVPGIEGWLVSRLSQRLGIPAGALDVQQPLTRYGLDSIVALELVADLEDWFGCALPLTLAWDCPTIAAIVQCVAATVSQPAAYSEPGIMAPPARITLLPSLRVVQPATMATSPLSYGQQALWFLHQQAPESTAYNIVRAARVRMALNVPALRGAFQTLVERHSALRTTFTTMAGKPVQQVHDQMAVGFLEEDASTWSLAFLQYRLGEEACRPFELACGPLLRVHLYTR